MLGTTKQVEADHDRASPDVALPTSRAALCPLHIVQGAPHGLPGQGGVTTVRRIARRVVGAKRWPSARTPTTMTKSIDQTQEIACPGNLPGS